MPNNAWSLLVFTLLSQISVGAFCVTEILNFSYSKEFGFKNLHQLRFFSRPFVLATIIFAGASSIFHLKNWAHAYHAFNNLKTSWVSKEMVLFFLFISCVCLLTIMSWRKIKAYLLQRLISIAGIICGIILIFSMAKIYMLPTIPVWDNWITPGFFSTTTLLLGSMAVGCLCTAFLVSSESSSLMDEIRDRLNRKTLQNIVKFSMIFVVSGIFLTGFFAHKLIVVAEEYSIENSLMSSDRQMLFFSRILFYILGWVLLLLFLKRSRHKIGLQKKSHKLIYGAFILFVLAEVVGRYLFYVSFFRIGL